MRRRRARHGSHQRAACKLGALAVTKGGLPGTVSGRAIRTGLRYHSGGRVVGSGGRYRELSLDLERFSSAAIRPVVLWYDERAVAEATLRYCQDAIAGIDVGRGQLTAPGRPQCVTHTGVEAS